MKRDTLALLACPACHAELTLHGEPEGETVESGTLVCGRCQKDFPIEEGIPRFIEVEELSGLNRRFAGYYNRFSRLYAPAMKLAFFFLGGDRKARKEILDRLEPAGGRVLEVSIGPGVNLPYLFESPKVGEIYGLDISQGQLQRCRSFCRKRGWAVDLFQGTAEALPFQDSIFSNVLHIGGINFFNDKKAAIEEMIRVAKPGAKVVIADETERVARLYDRAPGFSRKQRGKKADTAAPVSFVPETMQDLRVSDIWRAHGKAHGYCLEFRKPG